MTTKADTKMILAERRWVCMVSYSGYHNGCTCRPSDPHGGWDCGWYYRAEPVPAPTPRRHAEG